MSGSNQVVGSGPPAPLCQYCGKPLTPGAVFCGFCNSPIRDTPVGAQGRDGVTGTPGMLGPSGPTGMHPGVQLVGGVSTDYAVAPFVGKYESTGPNFTPNEFGDPDLGAMTESLSGWYSARVGKRFLAALIDGAIYAAIASVVVIPIVMMILAELTSPLWLAMLAVGALGLVAYVVLIWRWQANAGLTIGRKICDLRLVSEKTGGPPGWGPVAARAGLLFGFSIPTAGIGAILSSLSCLWDKTKYRRSWHDKISHLILITGEELPVGRVRKADAKDESSDGAQNPQYEARPAMATTPGMQLSGSSAAGLYGNSGQGPELAGANHQGVGGAMPGGYGAAQAGPPAAFSGGAAPSAFAPPPDLMYSPPAPAPGAGIVPPPPVSPPPAAAPPASSTPGANVASPIFVGGAAGSSPTPPVGELKYVLRFEDGAWVDVTGLTLIGRNPSPLPGEEVSWMVPWPDDSFSMSKTHLAVNRGGGQLWVTDRNSTNGTRIVFPDGNEMHVEPGRPVAAPIGSVIWCGDRRITVCEARQ